MMPTLTTAASDPGRGSARDPLLFLPPWPTIPLLVASQSFLLGERPPSLGRSIPGPGFGLFSALALGASRLLMASYGVASRSGLASDHLLTSCLLLLCKRTCVCVLSTLHHQPECTAGRVPSKIEGIFQRQGTQSIENGFNPIWVGPCYCLSLGCNWASDLVAN